MGIIETMNNAKLNQAIANTIRQQIGANTMMSCGAHNMSFGEGGQLTFKVGGKRLTWCEIALTSDDLYTVRVVKMTSKFGERKVVSEQAGIYSDMLPELVYRLFNK